MFIYTYIRIYAHSSILPLALNAEGGGEETKPGQQSSTPFEESHDEAQKQADVSMTYLLLFIWVTTPRGVERPGSLATGSCRRVLQDAPIAQRVSTPRSIHGLLRS